MIGWIRPSDASNPVAESGVVTCPITPEVLFLRRLHRLVELSERAGLDAVQRRQVKHALYSTYWDCVGLGMRDKATTILELPPQQRSIALP
jgi:hypothetical protein